MFPDVFTGIDYVASMNMYLTGDCEILHKASIEAEKSEKLSMHSQTTYSSAPHSGSYSSSPVGPFFRGTIPFAMMFFSVIDTLGFFIRSSGKPEETTQNVTAFLKFVDPKLVDVDITRLIVFYRHGLVHEFFPKHNQAISYHSNNPKGKLFFTIPALDLTILNVNQLETYLLTGMNKLTDGSFDVDHLNNRFAILKKHNEDKIKKSLVS